MIHKQKLICNDQKLALLKKQYTYIIRNIIEILNVDC